MDNKSSDAKVADGLGYETVDLYDQALEIIDHRPNEAAELLLKVIALPLGEENPGLAGRDEFRNKYARMKEEAVYHLGRIYAKQQDANNLKQLMVNLRPYFATISKSRSAKIGKFSKIKAFVCEYTLKDEAVWIDYDDFSQT